MAVHNLFEQSPVYRMACEQLRDVAGLIDLDPGVAVRLAVPKRSLVCSIPIRRDTGETEVFIGYRIQHSPTTLPRDTEALT